MGIIYDSNNILAEGDEISQETPQEKNNEELKKTLRNDNKFLRAVFQDDIEAV